MNTKDDIKAALSAIFTEMDAYLKTVDDERFKKRINGKWSIAQNLDHLSISNSITALPFNLPKFVLKQVFKTNNRPNRNYDEVIWRYQRSLGNGAKASLPFQPKISILPMRTLVIKFWEGSSAALLRSFDDWTEEDLDTYLLPHPILGKITARELLFFTVYHVGHHFNTIKNIN